MKYTEVIKIVINEERNGGDFGEFHIELGENEGENIPHFHLDNQETSANKKKKSAIRLDMNRYFIHGDKIYRLNSKERKHLIIWLLQKPITKINLDDNKKLPKNNWENLVNMWNNYYPESKINKNYFPNYSTLCKDCKEN